VIPSEGEALALHKKYGSNDRVVRHCQTVAMVAELLAEEFERRGHQVDRQAVRAAALLHDIGRSRIQTVRHGVEGASIVEQEGVDGKVVEIIRRHVGAGISGEEAKGLGLPDFDYIPRSLEERIVCFADKLVGSDAVKPFDEEVQRFKSKSHDVERLLALKKGLEDELGEDPEKLVLNKIKESRPKAPV
jgi:uncharacterized protein (TIGR00295 family)